MQITLQKALLTFETLSFIIHILFCSINGITFSNLRVPELQYSSFNSGVNFLKYFTYLIISNMLVKFNIEIKLNIFQFLTY